LPNAKTYIGTNHEARVQRGYLCLRRAVLAVDEAIWKDFRCIVLADEPDVIAYIMPCESGGDYEFAERRWPQAFEKI
jgi:hypothetical protein